MRYLRIYKQFIITSLNLLMVYRASLINHLINSVSWSIFLFVSVFFLTSKVSSIAGWDRAHLLLLAGVYNLIIGLFYVLFSRGLRDMSEIILMGKLDQYLLKPIDSQFHLSVREVNIPGSIRCIIGTIIIILVSAQANIYVSLLSFLMFLFSIAVTILFLYSIWFLVLTLLIWFPRLENLIDLLYAASGLGRYPREVLKPMQASPFAFLALPFFLTVSIPTKQLIGTATIQETCIFITLSVFLFLASRFFWKYALKSYTGSSI
jgi:ABC-2 type transport system permease protein